MEKTQSFKLNRVFRLMLVMLVVFFVSYSAARAETTEPEPLKYIIVWDNDGGRISFPLEENPSFKYNFTDSLVSCITSSNTIDLPLKDVRKYTLDSQPVTPTSIDKADCADGKMSYEADRIYLSNFRANTVAGVYTADGALMADYKADAAGNLTIPMYNWMPGVYIVKVNNVSYKIYKK